MLVSKTIPALYGGVSQQPDAQRSPIQLAEMINSWATVVDGIGKRPPTEHVAKLTTTALSSAYLHMINRDVTNQFIVTITDGDIEVYDLAGDRKGVSFPHGKAYLDVPNGKTAADTFACVTVADYTFVVNKTKVVQLGALNSDRTAQPIDYWNVNRSTTNGAQWQYPPNPPLGTYKGMLQTFQDLPEGATEGDTYQIRATADSAFAGYYVRRTQGTWIECTRQGAVNPIDATTMPWALVRQADGTWVFVPFSWAPRRVGDETTNPGPSFIGRTINDVFFSNNSLGFLVDENTVLSRRGDFGNFWRMTAIDLLEDDVIDVAATETKVTKMLHAVPMGGDIMLFSDQVQFRLDTGDIMTPTSCSLKPVTQYPAVQRAKPKALGSDVYFGAEEGNWVRLFEYFVDEDASARDAADITAHVPRYIPKGLRAIATSSEHDAVFTLTSGTPNRIYHYKFYWQSANEKAQSAWGYWMFAAGENVVSIECLGEFLYMVIVRSDGTYLEKLNLSANAVASGLAHEVYLDRRAPVTGGYDAGNSYTVFDLPYAVAAANRSAYQIVRGGSFSSGKGGLLDPASYIWINDFTVAVPGNVAGGCFFGRKYAMRWTFSKWFMEDRNGNADLSGRLQIRTVSINYVRAGYFNTEVSPYGSTPEVEAVVPAKLADFTGKVLGSTDLLIGEPVFDDGVYSFQVYGNAADSVISITNDSHLGAWFTAAEVECFWQKRARFA